MNVIYNPDTIPPGIMAYEKIKGIPIASDKIGIRNRSTIGRQVTKFIISFHQIPYEGLELAKNNDREKLMLLYRDTFNSLERELTTPELDIDLAPQLYLGEDFYNDVLEEYTKVFSEDEDIGKRAMKHQELRELRGLQYAIKYNDKDEFTDSIDKIRNRIIFR